MQTSTQRRVRYYHENILIRRILPFVTVCLRDMGFTVFVKKKNRLHGMQMVFKENANIAKGQNVPKNDQNMSPISDMFWGPVSDPHAVLQVLSYLSISCVDGIVILLSVAIFSVGAIVVDITR